MEKKKERVFMSRKNIALLLIVAMILSVPIYPSSVVLALSEDMIQIDGEKYEIHHSWIKVHASVDDNELSGKMINFCAYDESEKNIGKKSISITKTEDDYTIEFSKTVSVGDRVEVRAEYSGEVISNSQYFYVESCDGKTRSYSSYAHFGPRGAEGYEKYFPDNKEKGYAEITVSGKTYKANIDVDGKYSVSFTETYLVGLSVDLKIYCVEGCLLYDLSDKEYEISDRYSNLGTPTPSPTPSPTPYAIRTATPFPTISPTVAPTRTPIPTATPTVAPTATPVFIPTPTPTPVVVKSISGGQIRLSKTNYTYNGEKKYPDVSLSLDGVSLHEDYDYSVTYSNNRNAGTAKVTVTGEYPYEGSLNTTFKIKPKKVKKIRISQKKYTGKKTNPKVFTTKWKKLKAGRDYKIKKKADLKSVGKRTLAVKMKGNYTGTAKGDYTIIPGNVKGVKTTGRSTDYLKIAWKGSLGAKYYIVRTWDSKKSKYVEKKVSGHSTTIYNHTSDPYVSAYIIGVKEVKGKEYFSESKSCSNYTIPRAPVIRMSVADNKYKCYPNCTGYYYYERSESKSFYNPSTWSGYLGNGGYVYFTVNYYFGTSTVYIRMKRYVTLSNGHRLYSAWSNVKSVRC